MKKLQKKPRPDDSGYFIPLNKGKESHQGGSSLGEGVSEVAENESKLLVEIQIQLARIEKTLETVPMMAATLEAVKEIARDAQQSASSAHKRLDGLGPAKEIAEDGRRKAETALQRLDRADEDQKWFKRTFYGAVVVAIAGALVTVVLAAINLGGG